MSDLPNDLLEKDLADLVWSKDPPKRAQQQQLAVTAQAVRLLWCIKYSLEFLENIKRNGG